MCDNAEAITLKMNDEEFAVYLREALTIRIPPPNNRQDDIDDEDGEPSSQSETTV